MNNWLRLVMAVSVLALSSAGVAPQTHYVRKSLVLLPLPVSSDHMLKGGIAHSDFGKQKPLDFFQLLTTSDLVLIGTITQTDVFGRRLSKEELRNLKDLGSTLGGRINHLKIESVICASSDFKEGIPRPAMTGKVLQIFQKRDQMFTEGLYLENKKYLVCVKRLPNQEELYKEYTVVSGNIYYGTFDGNKFDLADKLESKPLQSILPVLQQLSDALAQATVKKKIDQLNKLANATNDANLKVSLVKIIELIKANARPRTN
ncbi:MAG: hypothetical protein HY011_15675 [Acidobacteria bacterium]|nr:hypothetical protein [Acidobacteriota bacterium]